MEEDGARHLLVVAATLVLAGCGPSIETNAVADVPPVDAGREVTFHEGEPPCEQRKVGDIRVQASDWPAARPDVEEAVRSMGGEAVVGWNEREVVVRPGGGGGSAVPGASSRSAERESFFFGVVVRFPGECPAA